jgi:hypothetical protein
MLVASLLNETIEHVFHISNDRVAADAVSPTRAAPQTAIGPQLDRNQSRTLARLRTVEHQRLSEYAWIDVQTGVARIPIERAMAIAAERGLAPTAGQSASPRGPAQ